MLTYNNVSLKNLIPMNAVFKNYDREGVWIGLMTQTLMLQCKLFQRAAPL